MSLVAQHTRWNAQQITGVVRADGATGGRDGAVGELCCPVG